ncbi:BTB/POZ protein [Rhizophagus clarus]|uniref:BTB/POZ protein n=1 Tax=Rhizophagus clarus TaxID=94130 RepID=A0A8H3R0Y7_9GLOM|nr:BTB/POZ protein [Rhizophagus clarus]
MSSNFGSQYFRSAFSNEWAEKKDGNFISKNQIFLHNYLILFLEFHIVPSVEHKGNLPSSRKPNPDSTLIEANKLIFLHRGLKKKDFSHYNRKIIPYKFKLLYHSNQDGNETKPFHRNCDNKRATIWIAKIKDS